jgi:hypothetical protein
MHDIAYEWKEKLLYKYYPYGERCLLRLGINKEEFENLQ